MTIFRHSLKSYYKTAFLFLFGGIACSELLKKSHRNNICKEMITHSYLLELNFGLAFQVMDIIDFTN